MRVRARFTSLLALKLRYCMTADMETSETGCTIRENVRENRSTYD